MQPIASRIFGVVPKELRSSKFLKLITLSGTTI
jgi:ribosomal protein L14